jgi:uncharacterized secreted repeat protein (TIGR03808 family)
MDRNRRSLLAAALSGLGAMAVGEAGAAESRSARRAISPVPTPLGTLGLEAATLGLRADADHDQSAILRSALAEAARRAAPLLVAPGRYRISGVAIPDGTRLVGIPGATILAAARPGALLTASGSRRLAIEGIGLDGRALPAEARQGLLAIADVADLTLADCGFANGGAVGLTVSRSGGRIANSRFRAMADAALFAIDSTGLAIEGNSVEDCGNNGIQVWRSAKGDDATSIRGNRVSRIRNDAGGDGPNGNGISIFRAGGVLVEGNTLRDCALTFIRNNSGSGVQILGNNGRRCGEVALYSEFAFEGAMIANNLVEDCAQGVNITNLDHGGRLAVCANNLIRTARRGLAPRGKELIGGIGIHVEAEAAVTGNVVEGASDVGISLGWSWGMRNLLATGNIIRDTGIGISVSLVPKERNALIANNVIAGARLGAVIGTEYGKAVTGDLAKTSDKRAAGVRVEGNAVA